MAPGDTARLYHALTSYTIGTDWDATPDDPRVVQGFVDNDLATFPPPCKSYADGLPAVELPRSWPPGATPTTAILAGGEAQADGELDLEGLAQLLHLSLGIVREAVRRDGRHYRFRATGSAGGLFPYEAYVAARGVDGLPDGVHWFDPLGHRLVQVGPAPNGRATTVVLTGIPWRTGWRYTERGFRHLYWDAGAVLAQQVAVAHQLGLSALIRMVFPDTSVTRLVGADGVQELPLALLTLGEGEPAIGPSGDAAQGQVAETLIEFPLVTRAQHAGDGDELGDPLDEGEALAGEVPESAGLDDVILRRASTRLLDPERSVSRPVFEWCMAAAMRGTRVPHAVAVHAVEGLTPGLYRWPDLQTPVRAGNLREELYTVCIEQQLGRDAAFVLVSAADLTGVDDRDYRTLQLEAGRVSGRMHLAAVALGIAATGMTFYDSEIPKLLGEPLAGLLITCVGVPAYRPGPAARPASRSRCRPRRSGTGATTSSAGRLRGGRRGGPSARATVGMTQQEPERSAEVVAHGVGREVVGAAGVEVPQQLRIVRAAVLQIRGRHPHEEHQEPAEEAAKERSVGRGARVAGRASDENGGTDGAEQGHGQRHENPALHRCEGLEREEPGRPAASPAAQAERRAATACGVVPRDKRQRADDVGQEQHEQGGKREPRRGARPQAGVAHEPVGAEREHAGDRRQHRGAHAPASSLGIEEARPAPGSPRRRGCSRG